MKVRLLESAHDTLAPAGTVGELVIDGNTRRFTSEDNGIPLWIGRVKWEEVPHGTMETDHGPVPVFVENGNDKIQKAIGDVLVKPRKRGK